MPSVSNEELIMQIARLELDDGKAEQKSGLEGKEGENEVGANENTGNLQNAENIESSENEIGGEESEEYDEDYYVSMDDIYHQETEFVNVNELMLSGNENPLSSFQSRGNPSHTGAKIPMTSSEFEVVKKNNLSGKEVSDEDKRHKDGIIKVDDESDGTDDFLRFLESTSTNKSKSDSVSASISQDINRKENEGIQDSKSIDGDSGMFSVDSGSAGIKTGTDPLSFTAVQNTTDRNATDSKTTSQDTNKIVKKSGDDIDELDELERYLLNLNG